jgi:hypothetical protein
MPAMRGKGHQQDAPLSYCDQVIENLIYAANRKSTVGRTGPHKIREWSLAAYKLIDDDHGTCDLMPLCIVHLGERLR